MQTISELYNSGFYLQQEGLMVKWLDDLTKPNDWTETDFIEIEKVNESDAKQIILDEFHKNEGSWRSEWLLTQKDIMFVKIYITDDGEVFAGLFTQLDDKFQDSTFVNESDKHLIEKIVARKDMNGKQIMLNDLVVFNNGYEGGRVVWWENCFCVINKDGDHVADLSYDAQIIKIN